MVKYLGSKRLLAPRIRRLAEQLPVATACDLFAGTTRVGQALREAGLAVHSNDVASYSEALGLAYVAAGDGDRARLPELLDHLRGVEPRHGYFTETFCVRSRYLQPHNGMRIDAIRDELDRGGRPPRYVGARIGIHNPRGEKVGTVSHVRNTEVLFVVGPDEALVARAVASA